MQEAKPLSCFVLMPHGSGGEYGGGHSEAEHVYRQIIQPGVYKALGPGNVNLTREEDSNRPGAITRDIVTNIYEADFAIVDITGRNPNVFLELGVRYALRRSITILMHQAKTQIPFDIRNFRCFEYNPFEAATAIDKLSSTILDSQAAPRDHSDSLVYEILPYIEVSNTENPEKTMPWALYWEKLSDIKSRLQALKKEKKYSPDVIVGLTNGGAIVADLLTMNSDFDCPVISLWANRNRSAAFFENKINVSLINGIKEFVSKDPADIRILLVDDVVSSANTYRQAIEFIQRHIPDCHVRFLPLLYRQDTNLQKIMDRIIWEHKEVKQQYGREMINQLHKVEWHMFPYGKGIRST